MASRLPLSAIVTSRNEARLLGRCLDAIAFCEELIVVDLESDDDTAAVAAAHGARVVRHPLVPIAEAARVTVAPRRGTGTSPTRWPKPQHSKGALALARAMLRL